ncbi:radical SAM protein [Bacteroidota bacterium]
MLTGVHFLLTYSCNFECDHCFLYSGPNVTGTFTAGQVSQALSEIKKIGTVEWIYFEGGEPFLFYPLMLHGVRLAKEMGFKVGLVTNSYWALSDEDAKLWLQPLADLGISDLSISDDSFHYGEEEDTPPKRALLVAKSIGIDASSICIQKPVVEANPGTDQEKGEPVIGGGAMFKGRAVEKLTPGLPRRSFRGFTECPHEDLVNPSRVHIDSLGNVHLCQGLSMGNMWKTALSDLVKNYDASLHPISGPISKGGPAQLAKEYNVEHEEEYVDGCHFCFLVRRALLERFPGYLAPKQVYGFESK